MGILDEAPEQFEYVDYRPELNRNLLKVAGAATRVAVRSYMKKGVKKPEAAVAKTPGKAPKSKPTKFKKVEKKRRAPIKKKQKKLPAGAVPALKTAPLPAKGQQIVLAKEPTIRKQFTEKSLKAGLGSSSKVTKGGSQASLTGKRASQVSLDKLMDDLNPPMPKSSQPAWVQARDSRKFGSVASLPKSVKSSKSSLKTFKTASSGSLNSFKSAKGSLSSLKSTTPSKSASIDSKGSLASLMKRPKTSLRSIKSVKPPLKQKIKKTLAKYR